ncbi:MAG TPA: hypothetical protein VJA22_00905 [Patescibacteria group bacterium]|nr:hypothetical protein [Patescibacteria group bacterium]
MTSTEELKKEIKEIQARNKRVEADKAWEMSWSRKLLILLLTYFVIVIFFLIAKLGNAFVNAIVPTIGFVFSTLSMPFFKNVWLKKHRQKKSL